MTVTKRWLYVFLACFPFQTDGAEINTFFLDKGGIGFSIPISAFEIEQSVENRVKRTESFLTFERSAKDFPFCIASFPKLFTASYDGIVFLIPKFSSDWIGSINPLQRTDLITAAFILKHGEENEILYVTTDSYSKQAAAVHENGDVFYFGSLDQDFTVENWAKKGYHSVPIMMLSEVDKDEEVDICFGYLTAGTTFTIKSITVIYYPSREIPFF